MSADLPDISIVVVSWNTRDALLCCLETVKRAAAAMSLEVIVVDNGSLDGSAEAVKRAFPGFRVIANRRNAGFARANNQALPLCRGRYILLLNPDTEVEADALAGLVEFMDSTPDAGAAGLQLRDAHGRRRNSYDNFHSLATELLSKHLLRLIFPGRYPSKRVIPERPIEVEIIIGACLMLRPSLLRELGGLDDRFFLFVEESDLCYRIRQAGWKIYHVPHLSIRHTHHYSKEQAPAHATIEYYRSNYFFFRKHASRIVAVTFRFLKTLKLVLISLNLSLIAVLFTLGRVPRHRRRLTIRAHLAVWHLLGCPASWGMRQVSGFRGYSRRSSRSGGVTSTVIVQDCVQGSTRRLAENPDDVSGETAGAVVVTKKSRTKTEYRIVPDDGRAIRLMVYRPRGPLHALACFQRVSTGMWCFEKTMEVSDQGIPTILPIAAGSECWCGIPVRSHVVFEDRADLVKLQCFLYAGADRADGRSSRAWFRAYGRFVRRLHDAGIVQRDLNPGNALVHPGAAAQDEDSILLVDLERVDVGPALPWDARKRCLARLNRIRAGIGVTDRLRFLLGYLEGSRSGSEAPGVPDRDRSDLMRDVVEDVVAHMPDLRRVEGRRAARHCTRENWYFGRLKAGLRGHFRRWAYPWDEAPLLEATAAAGLAQKVVGGDDLPANLVVRDANGGGGLRMWREANRAFQSGEQTAVPLLFVSGGGSERIVVKIPDTSPSR